MLTSNFQSGWESLKIKTSSSQERGIVWPRVRGIEDTQCWHHYLDPGPGNTRVIGSETQCPLAPDIDLITKRKWGKCLMIGWSHQENSSLSSSETQISPPCPRVCERVISSGWMDILRKPSRRSGNKTWSVIEFHNIRRSCRGNGSSNLTALMYILF